jgi:hypothetical protein
MRKKCREVVAALCVKKPLVKKWNLSFPEL